MATAPAISEREIEEAERTIAGLVRETPVLPAGELSRRVGANVLMKAENLQLTGAFKLRGASNKLARLQAEELGGGVVAASAGNHAQAVALAARRRGVRATLCMPARAPLSKVAAVRQYGGEVRLVDGAYEDAGAAANEAAAREGMTLIHPFDDADIVAGQGTVGLELARQVPDVAVLVVPVGGGGLVAGAAIALKARVPGVRVVGVQSEACAPYAEGRPERAPATICDGIAVKRPGELTGPLVERWVDEVVTVSDDEVAQAMVLLLERSKLVVEAAGAAGVAALMHGKVAAPDSGSVCTVLSGGNVDAGLLAECIRLGETAAGRRIVLGMVVPDRPGALAGLLGVIAAHGANVVDVEHLRDGMDLHVRETAVQLVLETRGPAHGREIVSAVEAEGFRVRVEH